MTTVNQCGFCAYLNTSFSLQCELCGDPLSPSNILPLPGLFTSPPQECRLCRRALLLNNSTCTYCVAQGFGLPPRVPVREEQDPLEWFTVHLMNATFMEPSIARSTPLHPAARDRVLTPVPPDTVAQDAVCPVCLDRFDPATSTPVVKLPCCSNCYHLTCVDNWFAIRSSCPSCRHNLNALVPSSDDIFRPRPVTTGDEQRDNPSA